MMGIPLGSRKILMAHHPLNGVGIHSALRQAQSKGMTERESVKPEALSLCFLRGLRLILRPPPLIVKHARNERPLFHTWDNDELPEEGEMEAAGLDESEGGAYEE